MLFLVLPREEWVAHIELIQDAAEAPHIDSGVVRDTKYNFWRSVKSRLDICVYLFIFETSGSKINNFDSRFVDLS